MTGSPSAAAPDPHLALLRVAQDRALEAEGIPMVLALLDARADGAGTAPGTALAAASTAVRADGERIAASADAVRAALLEGHRTSDLGATTAVMQAASYADFGRTAPAAQRLRAPGGEAERASR